MPVIWNWTMVILIFISIHSKMYPIKITQNISCIQLNFQCYTSDAFVLFFCFCFHQLLLFHSFHSIFFFFLMNFGITSLIVHLILMRVFALLSLIHSLFPFAEKLCYQSFIFGLPELRFLLPKTCHFRLYLCHFIVKICLHLYVKNY